MQIFIGQQAAAALPSELGDAALINVKTVCAATGFKSATSIYQLLDKGFPQPIRLSSRCTRWRVRDVRAWLEAQGQQAEESSNAR